MCGVRVFYIGNLLTPTLFKVQQTLKNNGKNTKIYGFHKFAIFFCVALNIDSTPVQQTLMQRFKIQSSKFVHS